MMEAKEAKRSKMPKTDIVCKFFLDAVKTKVYGFKWQCPNGDECHYKHCLPKDFVIKSLQAKTQEEMTLDEYQDLEETIDEERTRLAINGTKVNEKTFFEWKERKAKNKDVITTTGKKNNMELMKKLKTGRQLFSDNKDIFQDDVNADDDVYENECNELLEETKNLQDELWGKNEKKEDEEKTDVKVNEDLFQDNGDLEDIDLEEEEKIDEADDENEDN